MRRTLKFMTVVGFTAALIAPMAPANAAPPVSGSIKSANVTVAVTKKKTSKFTSTALNLRKGAGADHKKLTTIPKGKQVVVKTTSKGWSKITYGGQTGWVSSKYLTGNLPKVASKKKTAVKKATSAMNSKARAYANKYGCKSAGIVWNSSKLGKGANGTADWYNNDILLNSSMPAYRLEYVTAHECFHLKQYAVYKGDVRGMAKEFNKLYNRNSSDYYGLERIADCMTRAKGIKVYNYTNKCTGKVAAGAKKLLAGKRI